MRQSRPLSTNEITDRFVAWGEGNCSYFGKGNLVYENSVSSEKLHVLEIVNETLSFLQSCKRFLFSVRADGRATDCNSTDNNCPSYAACSNDTCSCNPGTRAENGLCTGKC